MKKLLKQKKLSETPFRTEVLEIFSKYNNAIPLSVLEKELTNYNRITLYRTIKVFIEKGIIHEIALSGSESSYAMCKDGCDTVGHHHQHVHFKCNECETIYCIEVNEFPAIDIPNHKIVQLEIQANGICSECSA